MKPIYLVLIGLGLMAIAAAPAAASVIQPLNDDPLLAEVASATLAAHPEEDPTLMTFTAAAAAMKIETGPIFVKALPLVWAFTPAVAVPAACEQKTAGDQICVTHLMVEWRGVLAVGYDAAGNINRRWFPSPEWKGGPSSALNDKWREFATH